MEAIRIRTLAKVRPSADCPSPRVETLSTSLENLSSGGADGCGWRDPRSVLLVWRSHLNNEGPPRYLRLRALMACGSDTPLRPVIWLVQGLRRQRFGDHHAGPERHRP